MAQAVLISLGSRDRLLTDGADVLASHVRASPSSVIRLENLAERALAKETGLADVFASADGCVVVGCSRPRAARALLAVAGVALPVGLIWLALPFDREALKTDYGVPWYPVIDRTLCTGCGTCRDYCLFSVYACDDALPARDRVGVVSPLNCKTGCPACARLCPTGALIFPFCHEAALNGEIETPAPRSRDALTAALGDDPMRLLAERRKQKQRLIDPSRFEQAEKDRVIFSGVL